MPEQWEDTSDMEISRGLPGKDITSGSPFLFYWVNDQIEIIKHNDDEIPWVKSDENSLMIFGGGLWIKAD